MSSLIADGLAPMSEAAPEAEREPIAERDEPLPTLPRAEPFFPRPDGGVEPAEAPRLALAPELKTPEPRVPELGTPELRASEPKSARPRPETKPSPRRKPDPLTIAAALATVGLVALGLFAAWDHMRERALVAARAHENQELARSVAALKSRVEAIETARADSSAELRKALADIKSAAASPVPFAQLAQRVDRMEKDQGARLEKLGEKLEQTAANRNAEIVVRLERLEKKATTVALVPPAPKPAVSNDITGSIERPKPVLRNFTLADVHDGVADLEGREGNYSVAPGDAIPGAGRVLKIERRGQGWVVVTSQGLITASEYP